CRWTAAQVSTRRRASGSRVPLRGPRPCRHLRGGARRSPDMLFARRPFGIIVGTARRNVYLISLVRSSRPKNGRSATRPHPNRSRWGGRTIAKYVLAADFTLMTDYRNVPLATFFSCIPTDQWQSRLVFRILANAP